MSRVRYVNKKTGWVSIYESTPYYDPVTKEFIPSSGKPGRKKHEQIDTSSPDSPTRSNQLEYKRALNELDRLRDENIQLQKTITSLKVRIEKLYSAFNTYTISIQDIQRST